MKNKIFNFKEDNKEINILISPISTNEEGSFSYNQIITHVSNDKSILLKDIYDKKQKYFNDRIRKKEEVIYTLKYCDNYEEERYYLKLQIKQDKECIKKLSSIIQTLLKYEEDEILDYKCGGNCITLLEKEIKRLKEYIKEYEEDLKALEASRFL